jgi:hypothetical protein
VLQDEAAQYILTTDFVTGVPFPSHAGAGGSKATNYLQYTYLMLYLERKSARGEEMTPLEAQVLGKVVNGDISWLPDGFDGHDRRGDRGGHGGEPGGHSQAELSTLQGTVAGVRGRGRRRHSRPSGGAIAWSPGRLVSWPPGLRERESLCSHRPTDRRREGERGTAVRSQQQLELAAQRN